jgi:hypothetical protein
LVSELSVAHVKDTFRVLNELSIPCNIRRIEPLDLREKPFFVTHVVKVRTIVKRTTIKWVHCRKLDVVLSSPAVELEKFVEQIGSRHDRRSGIKTKSIPLEDPCSSTGARTSFQDRNIVPKCS